MQLARNSTNRMAPKNITTCNNIGIKVFLATPVYNIVRVIIHFYRKFHSRTQRVIYAVPC